MRILLDQNVPLGVRGTIRVERPTDDIATAYECGWSHLSNGALLDAAEVAAFGIFVTCDQNLTYQQNLAGRRIRIVVLWTNRWNLLRSDSARIEAAIAAASDPFGPLR